MSRLFSLWGIVSRYKYLVIVLVSVLFIGFVDENSIYNSRKRTERIGELKKEIADYNQRYQVATDMLTSLDRDPHRLEQVAREKYYMRRPGEDVFVIKASQAVSAGEADSVAQDSVAR